MNDTDLEVVAAEGGLVRLRPERHTRIVCVSGTVWLTQENDSRDVFLQPGESCDLARRGLVLISACSFEARIRISRAGARLTIETRAGA